ncbi:MAG: apolipoprotein N-acyltransferase [Proteobacteria bacterium]|nr:apolipoprotein N-acyltransferase [Pseudomonadota bacterium]
MIGHLTTLSHAIMLAEGWRRRGIACLAGALGALALPPIGFIPAFALAFPVAVWLLDGATAGPGRFSPRALVMAARDGWWFGFGYFLAGLWWIGAAFLVETDEFAWAMPLGILGLPAVLACFTAAGFALARLFWFPGVARIFALTFGLGVSEHLRHFLFTGFPWNGFGQGLGTSLILAQGAALIGTDGLGLLTVAIFATPATLVANGAAQPSRRPVAIAALVLAGLAIFGLVRLQASGGINPAPGAIETVEGVRLRIVQPNMSQREKIAQRDGMAVLSRLLTLSDRASGPNATGMADASHVIWPESPFPFLLLNDPRAIGEIARVLPAKTTLVTGAVRMEDVGGGQPRRYFNSMLGFLGKGTLAAVYDKMHLVPFGEYLPFEGLLSAVGLRRFVHAPGAFVAGEERRLMELPGLPPALPIICYEAIFPYELLANSPRPGLILNITNDAWFGETFGPHQHFHQARLRAIEFGLPLVRAANTGISGVIDPYGRVTASVPIGVESIIDVFLPKALTATPYSSNGLQNRFIGLLLAFLLTLAFGMFGIRLTGKSGSRR